MNTQRNICTHAPSSIKRRTPLKAGSQRNPLGQISVKWNEVWEKWKREMKWKRTGEKKKEGGKLWCVHRPRGYRYPCYEPLRTTAHNDGLPEQNQYREQDWRDERERTKEIKHTLKSRKKWQSTETSWWKPQKVSLRNCSKAPAVLLSEESFESDTHLTHIKLLWAKLHETCWRGQPWAKELKNTLLPFLFLLCFRVELLLYKKVMSQKYVIKKHPLNSCLQTL